MVPPAAVLEVIGFLIILAVNTVAAALLTRFVRGRMHTRWGSMLYTLTLTPIVLIVLVVLLQAVLPVPVVGRGTLLGVTVLLPLSVGIAFDYFWMPPPEEVDLPEKYEA